VRRLQRRARLHRRNRGLRRRSWNVERDLFAPYPVTVIGIE
jgi:hypothetical protein